MEQGLRYTPKLPYICLYKLLKLRQEYEIPGSGGRKYLMSPARLFGLLWAILFLLYLPAARAGFVADFSGWLDQVRNHSFAEHLNRTHFQATSLYQFTQFNTYVLYRLFGARHWPWHLLFISLHALNATLLYMLVCRLLEDAGTKNAALIAAGGSLLFCVTPYAGEVVVWEPAFHFLQGLLLILTILLLAQRYVHTGRSRYAWWAGMVYLLSVFSLEIFYITPVLVITLGLFYRSESGTNKTYVNGIFSRFAGPMILISVLRFAAFRLLYGDWVSRIGSGAIGMVTPGNFGKPAKYLFHLLLLGRFFSEDTRHSVYAWCDSGTGMGLFYVIVAICFAFWVYRWKQLSGMAHVAILLWTWVFAALLLLIPLWFQADMLVLYDRYTYFAGSFFYMVVAISLSYISVRYAGAALFALYALVNLRYAIQVSRYWGKSSWIVNHLLAGIPAERNKTMLLLNLPQCMHGVAMIGAEKNSEFKLLHDLLLPDKPLTNPVYDVLAYNMNTPQDGAHVRVLNDSTLTVTLNQWGTWWWFETRGGYSYENNDYRLNLKDPGHYYELTLRKPANQYLLLYSVGDQWKTVDMNRRDTDQD